MCIKTTHNTHTITKDIKRFDINVIKAGTKESIEDAFIEFKKEKF